MATHDILFAMSLPLEPNHRYTVEEYLELEGRFPERKYEYREGYVVDLRELLAMAGGSPDHVLIATNIVRSLGNRLEGGPCRVYGSDLRVRIPRRTLFAYPDTTVVCGKPEIEQHPTAGATVSNPKVIVEVLSPSTESYDRGKKFSRYREIPSFTEYVLVSQTEPWVETFFKHDDGGWRIETCSEGAVKLVSLNLELPLPEIYAGVDFPSNPES
jgi:Uma2 family endonuclease